MVPGLHIPCHQMCIDDVIAWEVGSAGSVVKAVLSFLPSTPAALLVKTFGAPCHREGGRNLMCPS